jgi:hypothetical protein
LVVKVGDSHQSIGEANVGTQWREFEYWDFTHDERMDISGNLVNMRYQEKGHGYPWPYNRQQSVIVGR